MGLPHSETAISVASMLGVLVPVMLGLIRGFFPESGWKYLFAGISGLAWWSSLLFRILMSIWNRELFDQQEMKGLSTNGAANAFAVIVGWVPGVVVFFVTMAMASVVLRWFRGRFKEESGLDG